MLEMHEEPRMGAHVRVPAAGSGHAGQIPPTVDAVHPDLNAARMPLPCTQCRDVDRALGRGGVRPDVEGVGDGVVVVLGRTGIPIRLLIVASGGFPAAAKHLVNANLGRSFPAQPGVASRGGGPQPGFELYGLSSNSLGRCGRTGLNHVR